MVLVDTSVWIQHLRKGEPQLAELLEKATVLIHPFVLGELACGRLKNRGQFLSDLETLPEATVATQEETLELIHNRKLWGRGIGWIDAHLLASALLSNCRLWTLDQNLKTIADDLPRHHSSKTFLTQ